MKLKNAFPIVAMLLIVFMSGCKKDDENTGVRPTVNSTDPIKNATGIAINSVISATFSLDMNASTFTSTNFYLKQGTTTIAGALMHR